MATGGLEDNQEGEAGKDIRSLFLTLGPRLGTEDMNREGGGHEMPAPCHPHPRLDFRSSVGQTGPLFG